MKDPKLRPFKVSVTFQDLNGKNDNEEFVLDVAQFTGLQYSKESSRIRNCSDVEEDRSCHWSTGQAGSA